MATPKKRYNEDLKRYEQYNQKTGEWEYVQGPINAQLGDARDASSFGYSNIERGADGKIARATDATGNVTPFVNGIAPERARLNELQGRSTAPSYPSAAAAALDKPTPASEALERAGRPAGGGTPAASSLASTMGDMRTAASATLALNPLTATLAPALASSAPPAPVKNTDGSVNPVATHFAPRVLAGSAAESADAVRTMALAHRAEHTNPLDLIPPLTPTAQRYGSGGDFNTSQAAADRRAGKINDTQLGEVRSAADTNLRGVQAGPTDASRAMMSGRIGPAQQQQLSREAQTASSDAYYRTHPGEAAYRPVVKLSQAEGLTIGPGGQTINGQFAPEGSTVTFDPKGKPIITSPTSAPTQPAVVGATGGGSIARSGVPQVNNGVATAQNPQGSFVDAKPATAPRFENPVAKLAPPAAAAALAANPVTASLASAFNPASPAPAAPKMFAGFDNPALPPTVRGALAVANGDSLARPAASVATAPPTQAAPAPRSVDPTIDPIVSGIKDAASYAGKTVMDMQFGNSARPAAASAPPAAARPAPTPTIQPTPFPAVASATNPRPAAVPSGAPTPSAPPAFPAVTAAPTPRSFGASSSYIPQPSSEDVAKASNGGSLPPGTQAPASMPPNAPALRNTASTPQGVLNVNPSAASALGAAFNPVAAMGSAAMIAASQRSRFGDRTVGSAVSPDGPARSPDGPARSPDGPARSPDAKPVGVSTDPLSALAKPAPNPFSTPKMLTLGQTGRADPTNPVSHLALDPSTISLPPGPKPFSLADLNSTPTTAPASPASPATPAAPKAPADPVPTDTGNPAALKSAANPGAAAWQQGQDQAANDAAQDEGFAQIDRANSLANANAMQAASDEMWQRRKQNMFAGFA